MTDKEAYLEISGPNFNKKVFLKNFTEDNITIGRYPTCDIVLPSNEISRHHAIIKIVGSHFFLEDNGSSNGTFVNDTLINRKKLENGDIIKIGDFTLKFFSKKKNIKLKDNFETNKDKTFVFPTSQLTNLRKIPLLEKFASETQIKIIDIVLEASKSLLNSSDLDQVLDKVMDLIFKFLNADRGFLMLYDEDKKELQPKIIKYKKDTKESITFSKSIVDKVFSEGVSILTEDAASDTRFSQIESVIVKRIHSCMCVPLWINEKVIGVIYIDSVIYRNQFNKVDLYLLSVIATLAAAAIEKFKLNLELEKEKKIIERLGRYESPNVISKITSETEDILKFVKPENREITVFFCDIVNFTSLTERVSPEKISKILKTFFNIVTEIVFENEGTLDKYIGDAAMIIFGAPFPQENHADRALKTAIKIQKAIKDLNSSGKIEHKLLLRIGMNSGTALCGDIGSDRRLDFTCIGDTVNLASRLESQVANPGEIVIGELTKSLLKEEYTFEKVGPISVKGFANKIIAYKVKY